MKLNVLLAKTDHLGAYFKGAIRDYTNFFKNSQGSFKGEKKTYQPKEGTIDVPGKRANKQVVTTVEEKLQYFVENQKEYVDALFSQEATNAAGIAKATLAVDGKKFGVLSSLELLRLKSILENGEFEEMYEKIPTRADDEIWTSASSSEEYKNRKVFQGNQLSGTEKSVTKETIIVQDPNVQYLKDTSSYKPQLATKDTIIELGDYTHQKFSGEASHKERAEILARRAKLLVAVIEALKICNEVEAVPSGLSATALFTYLHKGE